MATEIPPVQPLSFGQRLGRSFVNLVRFLARLLLILLLGGLLGVGIFYGIPKLYQQYVLPLQESVRQLEDSRAQQEQTSQQLVTQLEEIQKRVNQLEARSDQDKQTLDDLGASLEAAPATQQAFLDAFQETQTALTGSLDEINAALDAVDQKLTRLTNALGTTGTDLESLDERVTTLQTQLESEDAPIAAVRRDLQLIKVMELLTRSRLLIVQNNLGLAAEDIQAARQLLASLKVLDFQQAALQAMINRLDLALTNLPSAPILAAEDLEIAWQLLKLGLPAEAPLPTETIAPTLGITLTVQADITATLPISPTATITITLTPTPRP
ncbi:MAG: hypothetical protein JXB15_00110 [Anaerolineales bacterium]|nr:hypothetical protein [Anaerolineales bacterium]